VYYIIFTTFSFMKEASAHIYSSKFIQFLWNEGLDKSSWNDEFFRVYIGGLWTWFYDMKTLDILIYSMFEKMDWWQEVGLYYWGRVWKLLGQENTTWNDIEIIEQRIAKAKQYFPIRSINILDGSIVKWHQRLYTYLEAISSNNMDTHDIFPWVKYKWHLDDAMDNAVAIHIAMWKDEELYNDIEQTIPKNLRHETKSMYYPLAEIGLRLCDFHNWIVIQWGADRQKKYDLVIQNILDGYYDSLQELTNKLRKVKNTNHLLLSSLYVNKKKTKQFPKQLHKLLESYAWTSIDVLDEDDTLKIWQWILIFAVSLWLMFGPWISDKYRHQNDLFTGIKEGKIKRLIANDTLLPRSVWVGSAWNIEVIEYTTLDFPVWPSVDVHVKQEFDSLLVYARDNGDIFTTHKWKEIVDVLSCLSE